jgi:hypothetical protein
MKSALSKEEIEAWSNTWLVIVDEISFAAPKDIEKICNNLQTLMRKQFQLYGGTNVVYAGDYSQLPPPKKARVYDSGLCPGFHLSLNCYIELDGTHRYKDDPEWGQRLLANDGIAPYDASFRQGIRFWARIGDTSTRQVRFNIGDYHSDPAGDWCIEDGAPACFTYDVDLSQIDTTWKQYVIPFGALVHPTPDEPNEPIDTTTLRTLAFYFHASAVFDFWVDDLEFY